MTISRSLFSGRLAAEVGSFSLVSPSNDGAVTLAGKYVVVWQRGANGLWRVTRDIWNLTP